MRERSEVIRRTNPSPFAARSREGLPEQVKAGFALENARFLWSSHSCQKKWWISKNREKRLAHGAGGAAYEFGQRRSAWDHCESACFQSFFCPFIRRSG